MDKLLDHVLNEVINCCGSWELWRLLYLEDSPISESFGKSMPRVMATLDLPLRRDVLMHLTRLVDSKRGTASFHSLLRSVAPQIQETDRQRLEQQIEQLHNDVRPLLTIRHELIAHRNLIAVVSNDSDSPTLTPTELGDHVAAALRLSRDFVRVLGIHMTPIRKHIGSIVTQMERELRAIDLTFIEK